MVPVEKFLLAIKNEAFYVSKLRSPLLRKGMKSFVPSSENFSFMLHDNMSKIWELGPVV